MTILTIGLTGGIGCGKSTVCDLFAQYNIHIIDADLIAREIVEPGQPALKQLIDCFGPQILQSDGGLDRSLLRQMVFKDEAVRQTLNAIMHPIIYQEIARRIGLLDSLYCIVAVPLLFETGYQNQFDRILVIDCDPDTQIQRVSQRDQVDLSQIQAILDSQIPRSRRLELADDVISNMSSLQILAEQVKKLHNSYTQLAKDRIQTA